MTTPDKPDAPKGIFDGFCVKCKQPLRRLVLLAMLDDAGAKCYPNALQCSEGVEHEF